MVSGVEAEDHSLFNMLCAAQVLISIESTTNELFKSDITPETRDSLWRLMGFPVIKRANIVLKFWKHEGMDGASIKKKSGFDLVLTNTFSL